MSKYRIDEQDPDLPEYMGQDQNFPYVEEERYDDDILDQLTR